MNDFKKKGKSQAPAADLKKASTKGQNVFFTSLISALRSDTELPEMPEEFKGVKMQADYVDLFLDTPILEKKELRYIEVVIPLLQETDGEYCLLYSPETVAAWAKALNKGEGLSQRNVYRIEQNLEQKSIISRHSCLRIFNMKRLKYFVYFSKVAIPAMYLSDLCVFGNHPDREIFAAACATLDKTLELKAEADAADL